MRNQHPVIALLREMVDIFEVEIERNPKLELKLESLAKKMLRHSVPAEKAPESLPLGPLPDIYKELEKRGLKNFSYG